MSADEPPPDWLPPGWKMTVITRLSGGSVGRRDKYYINPDNGQKFRSKKEVLNYLANSSSISATPNHENQEVSSRKRGQHKELKDLLPDGWTTDTKSRLYDREEKYYINPANELKSQSKYEGLQYPKTSSSKDVIHILEEDDFVTPIPDSKVVMQKESNESIPSAARNEWKQEKNFTRVEINDLHNDEPKVEWKRTKQRAIKTCKRR